jgi:hypothetical protein
MQTTDNTGQAAPAQVTITTVGPNGKTQTISTSPEAIEARAAEPAVAPVAIVEHPRSFPSDKIVSLGIIGSIIVLFPMSCAMAIRMLRRPQAQAAINAPGVEERFTRLEQSIDAIAIEMERVSEGQRYVTKLLATEKAS